MIHVQCERRLAAATAWFGLLRLANVHAWLAHAAWRRWNCLHAILNLGSHGHKCLLDIGGVLGTCFKERNSQMIRKFLITELCHKVCSIISANK